MKRLFFLLLFIFALYLAKPFWEGPVSSYVDISFLDPVDEKVEAIVKHDSIQQAKNTTQKYFTNFFGFLSTKSAEVEDFVLKKVDKPNLKKPTQSNFSIHNIEIGTSLEDVTAQLGEPKSRSLNDYGTEWLTFHDNYQNFVMVSLDQNNCVNALYTNDDLISSSNGIQYGSAKSFVREKLGKPLTKIRKGLQIYMLQDDEGLDLFKVDQSYVYVFYDLHQNDQVTAIHILSAELEHKKEGIYANSSLNLRLGFEQQLFDLTNAARVRHGRSILKWHNEVATTAHRHSIDMATHDYFSHDNLQGQSPFDRMKQDGVRFRRAGENLAYGQSSSIFAHEGLMNSKGHRENILIKDYSHLGIGVDFNTDSKPYFTENFLLQ